MQQESEIWAKRLGKTAQLSLRPGSGRERKKYKTATAESSETIVRMLLSLAARRPRTIACTRDGGGRFHKTAREGNQPNLC